MRRPSLVISLAVAFAYVPLTLAAQHAAAPPAVPAPAVHFAPPSGSSAAAHSPSTHPTSHVAMRTPTHGSTGTKSVALKPPTKVSPGSGSGNGNGTNNGSVYAPTFSSNLPSGPVLLPEGAFGTFSGLCSPLNCTGVPGLGFDYTHFFATHPNWGAGIRTAGVVVPFGGGGGFYLPIPYYMPGGQPEDDQAPPDENANSYEPDNGPNDDGNTGNNGNRQMMPPRQPAPSAAQDNEPVYDYVFVKRDGTKIFAVAYSLTKDKLSYVTREGLRRTLSLEDLDFAATQKSNEERGNTISLPTPPPAAMAAL